MKRRDLSVTADATARCGDLAAGDPLPAVAVA